MSQHVCKKKMYYYIKLTNQLAFKPNTFNLDEYINYLEIQRKKVWIVLYCFCNMKIMHKVKTNTVYVQVLGMKILPTGNNLTEDDLKKIDEAVKVIDLHVIIYHTQNAYVDID